MSEHEIRIQAALGQLVRAVHEPWETLGWVLEQYTPEQMGDPGQEGSGAWHLVHLGQIFRVHAAVFMGEDAVDAWPELPGDAKGAGAMVKQDLERFVAWCREDPSRVGEVEYGQRQGFEDMLGVMLRHIVWHAAAVHYWCIWKGGVRS